MVYHYKAQKSIQSDQSYFVHNRFFNQPTEYGRAPDIAVHFYTQAIRPTCAKYNKYTVLYVIYLQAYGTDFFKLQVIYVGFSGDKYCVGASCSVLSKWTTFWLYPIHHQLPRSSNHRHIYHGNILETTKWGGMITWYS